MNCAKCGHAHKLHVPGTDQCSYRLEDEYRCVCDGYQAGAR